MRHDHPNWHRALLVAVVVAWAGSGGCSNQQTPQANPFMGPDRVPPPATRTLAPGTAQPYYPGDPLPTMQGAVAPAPAGAVAAAPTILAPQPTVANEPTLAASAQSVAIPDDGQSLRFALPAPPPAQVVPATPVVAAPMSAPVQFAAAPVPYGSSAVQPVQPAAYTSVPTPVANVAVAPAAAVDPSQLGPWRAPRIASAPAVTAPPAATPMPLAPTVFAAPQGVVAVTAQPAMSVQLRPVTSPDAGPSPTPRIRVPSYASSFQPPVVPNAPVQPAAYAGPTPSGGVVQTVQITELPASSSSAAGIVAAEPSVAPTSSATVQPTYVASASHDGFRPRGSTR